MTAFTPAQRAKLRDAVARSRLEAEQESKRLAAATAEARLAEKREQHAVAPSKKHTRPRRRRAQMVEPVRALIPVAPPTTEMEVTLTRDDLTPDEQRVFDRLNAAVHHEFSTIDVDTHVALVARVVSLARRADTSDCLVVLHGLAADTSSETTTGPAAANLASRNGDRAS